MKFYCIYIKEDDSVRLLKEACAKRKIPFIQLDPENYDYTQRIRFSKRDMLYRVVTTSSGRDLEKFLLDRNVSTFYRSYERSVSSISNILVYEKEDIPRPKTIYRLTRNKKLLQKYAEKLGFPLIIKAMGGSHGVGILKIDSLSSLYSISDYLLSKGPGSFVMKEFVDVTSSARLIVLGNKVIDSIKYLAPENDFRSNEGAVPNVTKASFPKNIEKIATRTVKALGVEFGGVDILISKSGKPYVAEMNFPCFFPRCQMLTGTDIAGKMIDHLAKKTTVRN